jgi:predicted N-formylglutamate amidohydrolase
VGQGDFCGLVEMGKSIVSRVSGVALLITCEHAGNRIPAEYAALFRGAEGVLGSHRGWDPGSLAVGRVLSRELDAPLLYVRWSRLLVESNRSPTNPRIWSEFTAPLPAAERARILDRYWRPHRERVEASVRSAVAASGRAVHLAVHSFTSVLDGQQRNADIGLLYDPARSGERELCDRWLQALRERLPEYRLRRNYPYRGNADGLTTWLRRRFPDTQYAGIELEINQDLLTGNRRQRWTEAVRVVTTLSGSFSCSRLLQPI